MALVLGVMFVGDHPRLLSRYRQQVLVLDTAITDETLLVAQLERLLGARVHSAAVERTDLVTETTVVEVRYSYAPSRNAATGPRRFTGAGR